MKKILLPVSAACLFLSVFAFSSFKASGKKAVVKTTIATTSTTTVASSVSSSAAAAHLLYDSLNLADFGIKEEVLALAYKGHQKLVNRGALANDNVIAICDFSQSSSKKRLYIIDTKNFRVLYNTYVAHGKNSGTTYAQHFSNTPESLQSSLGFYTTTTTYNGKHGLSLKLEGLERGFNDNAASRAVVMHGADYIGDHRLGSAYMGRSFGCPAVPQAQSATIINLLKNGTCLFIYHPTTNYLNSSNLLNS